MEYLPLFLVYINNQEFFYRFFLWIVQPQRVSVKHDPFLICSLTTDLEKILLQGADDFLFHRHFT